MESEAFQVLLQQTKQQGEWPVSPSEMTAMSLVFDTHCVRTHCHTNRSHLVTDLFGQLQKDMGGRWFHLNEEMEELQMQQLDFKHIYTCARKEELYPCSSGLCWKLMILKQNKAATFNFVIMYFWFHLYDLGNANCWIPLTCLNSFIITPDELSQILRVSFGKERKMANMTPM